MAAEVPPGHNVPYLDFILSNLCRDIFWQRGAAAYRAGDIWGEIPWGGGKEAGVEGEREREYGQNKIQGGLAGISKEKNKIKTFLS